MLSSHIAHMVGDSVMAGCFCKELRKQGGKIVHKRTYYAKMDGTKCCNEAMVHKNNTI